MDSDPLASQPTQLLQHALAPIPQSQEPGSDLASPNGDGNVSNDFSLDSSIIPVRPATPCYHLQASLLQSPEGSGEHGLAADSLEEKGQDRERGTTSPSPSENVSAQGSSSEPFYQHGDSPGAVSASAPNVIATRTASFQSPPATAGVSLSRPTKSMPIGNGPFRRSPSFPSQDSFASSISQDPAEQYLASAKQFDVPLSDLGETPTQEVIYTPSDPGATLPDPSSQHREIFEAAVREYEAQRASRATSNDRTKILVAATPSTSSGDSQNKHDDFSFQKFGGQESRFQFEGPSSYDKMLDRGLTDAPDPTPERTQPQDTQPTQVDGPVGVEPSVTNDALATPPRSSKQSSPPFEWIAPSHNATVASSNPRSLLRMVHPGNQYRIAKMRILAGNVEPPSRVTMGAETQPSHMGETQPCHADGPAYSSVPLPGQPTSHQDRMTSSRQVKYQPEGENEHDVAEDALDIVPDSEPLRAGPSSQTPGHHRATTQSPLKRPFRPISPISEHGSGDLVPDSLEVEESETDVPLAIQLASKDTQRSVPPTERLAVHGGKARTLSSAVPVKTPLPVIEKQPRKPVSTKAPRGKPSKTESAEVPTSLPEQDLRGQAFFPIQSLAVTTKSSSTKKKRGGSPPLEPSRTTCLPATKPVAGKKRSHSTDTESSNDMTCQPQDDGRGMRFGVQKEEEEESESVDDDEYSPPASPPKPDTSRKKRRCTEDVNPTHGTSKASTSTRIKRSGTPAIVTRSVKRLRSGVSSTRALSTEPPTRVFALWKQDGHYYSGVIYSRGLNNRHLIKFDDRTEDEVELKNMRRRELLVGDRVIVIQDNVKGVVSDVSRVDLHGSVTVEVDDGEAVATVQVAFGDIRIANRTIQSQWKERMVVVENIVTVVKPKAPIDTTPSKQSVVSTVPGKPQRELAKTGFVVTINPKNEDPIQTKDEAMRAIKQYGGLVIEDWSSVFSMEGKHSQSNKRWIATPQDFRWRSEVKLDRVFLLSDDAHQKPKFLLALALGIPCLSFEWLTKEGKLSTDWQPFLLPAGYSDTLGARITQLVDLDWGNCTEHLVDIMANRVPIKLFSHKTVLCIGADLVPPPPRKNAPDEASRYVPWIILCMGAAKVEAVTDAKQVSPGHLETFDYIIVKERSILGSVKLGDNVVVGDVNWVKECLVSSRLLSIPESD